MVMASPIHAAAVALAFLGSGPDPAQMLSIGAAAVEILAQTKV